jgi:hypothetical protein
MLLDEIQEEGMEIIMYQKKMILNNNKFLRSNANVLNLHRIDLAIKYHTHLQREIEKEETRDKELNNSH